MENEIKPEKTLKNGTPINKSTQFGQPNATSKVGVLEERRNSPLEI